MTDNIDKIKLYHQKLYEEQIKIRYLQLREKITYYALDLCVGNYEKNSLNENEIECIEHRTRTFLNTYQDFLGNNKENFPNIFKKNF